VRGLLAAIGDEILSGYDWRGVRAGEVAQDGKNQQVSLTENSGGTVVADAVKIVTHAAWSGSLDVPADGPPAAGG
jgi:hypothetical protein